MAHFEDLTSQRFGRLRVVKRIPNKHGRVYWLCRCSCGTVNEVSAHNLKRGLVVSCGCSRKQINRGRRQWLWKGNEASYKAIHIWLRHNTRIPLRCSICGKVGDVELANISGLYKRDVSDYEWLCRKCHMTKDGRIQNLALGRVKQKTYQQDNLKAGTPDSF